MNLQERLSQAEATLRHHQDLQARALQAANDAAAAILRLDGQILLLKELIAAPEA